PGLLGRQLEAAESDESDGEVRFGGRSRRLTCGNFDDGTVGAEEAELSLGVALDAEEASMPRSVVRDAEEERSPRVVADRLPSTLMVSVDERQVRAARHATPASVAGVNVAG